MNPMPNFLPGFRSAEINSGLEFVSQILATVDEVFMKQFLKICFVKTHNSLKIKLTF